LKQDKTKEIRYTKNKEFTNKVAEDFLNRKIKIEQNDFIYPNLLNPHFG